MNKKENLKNWGLKQEALDQTTESRILMKKEEFLKAISEKTGHADEIVGQVMEAFPEVILDAAKKEPPKPGELVIMPLPNLGEIRFGHVDEYKFESHKNEDGTELVIPEHITFGVRFGIDFRTKLNPNLVRALVKRNEGGDVTEEKKFPGEEVHKALEEGWEFYEIYDDPLCQTDM